MRHYVLTTSGDIIVFELLIC